MLRRRATSRSSAAWTLMERANVPRGRTLAVRKRSRSLATGRMWRSDRTQAPQTLAVHVWGWLLTAMGAHHITQICAYPGETFTDPPSRVGGYGIRHKGFSAAAYRVDCSLLTWGRSLDRLLHRAAIRIGPAGRSVQFRRRVSSEWPMSSCTWSSSARKMGLTCAVPVNHRPIATSRVAMKSSRWARSPGGSGRCRV